MGKFVNKINFSINEFGFAELDRNWRTENFHLTQLGIPFTRLYYPIEGCGYILLDGKKHVLSPGKIYLIAPYAPVKVECPKRLVKYWGHFNAYMPDSTLDIFTFASPLIETKDNSPEFTISLFKILCGNYLRSGTAPSHLSELENDSALTLLLTPFFRARQDTLLADRKFARFSTLLAYIEKHLDEGLTLHELGKFMGLNPTYLSNLFAAETGIPLMKYCKQRSVHRAIELMRTSKYFFSEAAYRAGAQNVTAFSRLFKKQTGLSPRNYKKHLVRMLQG